MAIEPAVEVTGLRVRRGSTTVFDGIDVTIPRGQITGLLGPSGCGKTTLMRSSYAIDTINAVAAGDEGWDVYRPLLVVVAFGVGALVLASLTLRRRTP